MGRSLDAFRDGDVDGLRELLAADVQLVGDGGGKAPQWADRFIGPESVARVLAVLVRMFARIEAEVEPHQVNGQPGAIFRDRDGRVLNTWALDILDGQIQTIRSVINPDKLGHVAPVADAWAALREATRLAGPETDRKSRQRSRTGARAGGETHRDQSRGILVKCGDAYPGLGAGADLRPPECYMMLRS